MRYVRDAWRTRQRPANNPPKTRQRQARRTPEIRQNIMYFYISSVLKNNDVNDPPTTRQRYCTYARDTPKRGMKILAISYIFYREYNMQNWLFFIASTICKIDYSVKNETILLNNKINSCYRNYDKFARYMLKKN
jgi:hypothetical protein